MTETKYGIPYPGPVPSPTPEHQRKITKQKWFEIGLVVILVVGGVTYLILRDVRSKGIPDAAHTLAESAKAIEAAGGAAAGDTTFFGRHSLSFRQDVGDFVCHVELVGMGEQAPLETAIVWLTPMPGMASVSIEALQEVVDKVALLGQRLVRSSSVALETATKTMETVEGTGRVHDKGVAATGDGWKITYITYRSFDESAAPVPMLCLVLQRLSAASDPGLADFNKTLYSALEQGLDAKVALEEAG